MLFWATQVPLQTVIFKKLFHLHEVQELVKLISSARIQSVIPWDEGESWLQNSRREFAGVMEMFFYPDWMDFSQNSLYYAVYIFIFYFMSISLHWSWIFFNYANKNKKKEGS